MIDETSLLWFVLRERRSSLVADTKLVNSAARRQTFAAAMAQFEEQMTAAKVVTPATRPLNLYYALAQAGMAISAAHAPDPWGFSRHGLKLVDASPDLADIQVRPEGEGGFQRVAAVTGSPGLSGPVSLGALWGSLPEMDEIPKLPGREVLLLIPVTMEIFRPGRPQVRLYLPHQMPEDHDEFPGRLAEVLKDYPGAPDWAIPAEPGSIRKPANSRERWEVVVEWQSPPLWHELPEDQMDSFVDKVAPRYRYRNSRYLRPSVEGDGKPPPSPLMTWWLLLYSLSMLARYQPRNWVRLLDLDHSASAVTLQYALELALSVVPQLVLGALDGQPLLLSRPMAF